MLPCVPGFFNPFPDKPRPAFRITRQPLRTIKNAPKNVRFKCVKLKTVPQFFTPPTGKEKISQRYFKICPTCFKICQTYFLQPPKPLENPPKNTGNGRHDFLTIPLHLNYTETTLSPTACLKAFPCGRQVICRFLPQRSRGRAELCRQGR